MIKEDYQVGDQCTVVDDKGVRSGSCFLDAVSGNDYIFTRHNYNEAGDPTPSDIITVPHKNIVGLVARPKRL